MSKCKYTPGPWKLEEKQDSMTAIFSPQEYQIGWVIQEWKNQTAEGIDRANARLITAAPELLEALNELEKNASQALQFLPHIILIHAVNEARKAIAKAEGTPCRPLVPEDLGKN